MKFLVTRSSEWVYNTKEPPTDGCTKETKTLADKRNYSYWTKEFSSLEDILDLMAQTKESVVIYKTDIDNYPEYTIEIYDDYRE